MALWDCKWALLQWLGGFFSFLVTKWQKEEEALAPLDTVLKIGFQLQEPSAEHVRSQSDDPDNV